MSQERIEPLPRAGRRQRPGLPAGRALMVRTLVPLMLLGVVMTVAAAQNITVWTTYQGAALAWLRSETTSFGAAFDQQVQVVPLKLGEIKQGAMENAEKGHAGDLFVGVPQDQFSALAEAGVLADMSNYATPLYLAGLSDQARLAFQFGGTLYGLPLSVQGPALIINTALVPRPPATYQALLDQASKLTTGGRYGFAFDVGNFYYAYAWLHTWGGDVFGRTAQGDLDPGRIELASAGAVAGAQALKTLRFDAGVMPKDTDYTSIHKLFLDGKLAMTYDGPWAIPSILAAGIPVAVAPMPPEASGHPFSGFMNVDGVLLNHYSHDPIAAVNLAKWLTTADAQVALARQAGMVPASSVALGRLADDAIVAGFGAALANAEAIPNVPTMGAVWGPMDHALASILASNESDVKAALGLAADAIAGK